MRISLRKRLDCKINPHTCSKSTQTSDCVCLGHLPSHESQQGRSACRTDFNELQCTNQNKNQDPWSDQSSTCYVYATSPAYMKNKTSGTIIQQWTHFDIPAGKNYNLFSQLYGQQRNSGGQELFVHNNWDSRLSMGRNYVCDNKSRIGLMLNVMHTYATKPLHRVECRNTLTGILNPRVMSEKWCRMWSGKVAWWQQPKK